MEQNGLMSEIHEVGVVGGGPAGLQAALTLGRMHVATVLFDDARYRNATAAQMHNVLGWDGAAPAALRAAGHTELAAYPWVSVVATQVITARADPAGLLLCAADSGWLVQRLLIATGVADAPLPIAGLAELWGDVVLPCPYCHGHEFSPGPIAVISSGSHAEHVGNLLRKLATAVPVFAPGTVAAVTRTASGVVIGLRDGAAVEAACVFVAPNPTPRVQIAEALVGCDRTGRHRGGPSRAYQPPRRLGRRRRHQTRRPTHPGCGAHRDGIRTHRCSRYCRHHHGVSGHQNHLARPPHPR